MNYSAEFETVDLIARSSAETRGVDAFALALIKAERQIRKLFTYLVFQLPCFTDSDIIRLREALGSSKKVYFNGVERGFNALYPRTIGELVGDQYPELRKRIDNAIDCRNKIFHGQLTSKYLSREDLLAFVVDIRAWCAALATGAKLEVGYDGFARNSFQKSELSDLSRRFKVQFSSIEAYAEFIRQHMESR